MNRRRFVTDTLYAAGALLGVSAWAALRKQDETDPPVLRKVKKCIRPDECSHPDGGMSAINLPPAGAPPAHR